MSGPAIGVCAAQIHLPSGDHDECDLEWEHQGPHYGWFGEFA